MTSHMRLPQATPSCGSYERTDGRTNEESWLRTRDNSPSVTRAHTYGDSPFADLVLEAVDALESARTRMGSPRIGEQRQEIHPWTRRAIYWRDCNRCMCDRCWTRPRWGADHQTVMNELDPDSTFRLAIFCGRCSHVDVCTDEGRVL